MGEIITFYSYKGGVGRSMLLANTAVMMCKWGYNVLMVDWDLEAPGLEKFFSDWLPKESSFWEKTNGIVDFLANNVNWKELPIEIKIEDCKGKLEIISSGSKKRNYYETLRQFNYQEYYKNSYGGASIENLRKEWKNRYDYILIDSRTGVTDAGGICTVQLPDIVTLVFTATKQSLDGVVEVGTRINSALLELPVERSRILLLPIVSRFDGQAEHKVSQYWIDNFNEKLKNFYLDWLPRDQATLGLRREFIELTKVPYVAYFSFGEKLPIIEQGTSDPTSIGYAYESISALLVNSLTDIDLFKNFREKYINQSNKNSQINSIDHYLTSALESQESLDYQTSIAKYEKIIMLEANKETQSENYLLNLITSYTKLGEIFQTLGQLDHSLYHFEKLNDILNNFYKNNIESDSIKNNLANSYSKLGLVYQSMGLFDQALTCFENSISYFEELCVKDTTEGFNYSLGKSYSQLGDLLQIIGRKEWALTAYEKQLSVFKELYYQNPNSENVKIGLGIAYEKLGNIYQADNNFEEALIFFEDRNKIAEELYKNNPRSENLKNSLAISYSKLGTLYEKQGDFSKASKYFERDLELAEELYKNNPLSIDLLANIVISNYQIASLHKITDQKESALFYFTKAKVILEELIKIAPQVNLYTEYLININDEVESLS